MGVEFAASLNAISDDFMPRLRQAFLSDGRWTVHAPRVDNPSAIAFRWGSGPPRTFWPEDVEVWTQPGRLGVTLYNADNQQQDAVLQFLAAFARANGYDLSFDEV